MSHFTLLKIRLKKKANAKEFEEWPEKKPYFPPQDALTKRMIPSSSAV